jgi:PAS domain S-box-containing protein
MPNNELPVELRNLLDHLPDPVLLLSRAGELLHVNPACTDQLGWGNEALKAGGLPELPGGRSLSDQLGDSVAWPGKGEEPRILSGVTLLDAAGVLCEAELTLSPFPVSNDSSPPCFLLQLRRLREPGTRLDGFQTLFRDSDDYAFIKDRERRYLAVNPSMCAVHGIKEEDILGQRADKLFPSKAAKAMKVEDERVLRGERVAGRIEMVDDEGILRVYEAVKTPIRSEANEIVGICGISREIDESKQLRDALRGKEERLQALTNSIPGHVFSYIRSPDHKKYSLYRSSGLQQLIGKHNADRVQQGEIDYEELIQAEDFANFPEPEVLPDGDGLRQAAEYRLRREDGSYRWILMRASGRLLSDDSILWTGILLDIDARKRAEEQLRLANQQLLSLAKNLPGLVYSYRKHVDGYREPIFFTLDRFTDLIGPIGAKKLEVNLEAIDELMHPDDRQRVPRGKSPGEGKPLLFEMEYRLRQDDGAYRWVYSRSSGFEQADGTTIWHGFLLDIDARKRAEENLHLRSRSLEGSLAELDKSRQEAEAASQAKGRFLASMSHEIRTPLTAVLGFTDILAERLQDTENLEFLAVIRRNGDHLLEIIKDILDLAKVEAGRLKVSLVEVDALTELRSVAVLMSPHIQAKSLELVLDLPETLLAPLKADATRLRQVLLNLLGNALKFTEQGKITLRARERDGDPRLLEMEIIDTGVGIDPDERESIFEVFTQIDRGEILGGAGLGLAISKQLVELMGGDIEFEAAPDGGSCFRVLMPLAAPALVTEQQAVPTQDSLLPLDARILLAEDNMTNQMIVTAILEAAGCSLDIADDGKAAVAMEARAREEGWAYDAILMDIQMPVMDGIQATQTLRKAGCRLPIIALTAHALDEDRERCLAAGCDYHLGKPIDRGALVVTLARFIGSRGMDDNPMGDLAKSKTN